MSGQVNSAEDSVLLDDISISSIQPIVSDAPAVEDIGDDDNVSDATVAPNPPKDPTLVKYHAACQRGDLKTVKDMIEAGLVDVKADWDEEERVSGLHWASANNRLNLVRYLIAQGADVNIKGGDLEATPLHWASKSGYVYIVHCLLEHGADPLMTDRQGYNLLHTSTFSSEIMLIIYVLFTGRIPVDSPDPTGKTALHWAAYQGDPATVEVLLKFDANVRVVDSGGFTPLHWATVKGNPHVLKDLIEHGSDVFLKNNDGKNALMIAQEMNTEKYLQTALYECGFNKDGFAIRKYFKNPMHAKMVTFFTPWVAIGLIFGFLAHFHILVAILGCLLTVLITGYGLYNFVFPSFILTKRIVVMKTPFLAGILSGTIFWLFYVWAFKMLPATFDDEVILNFTICAIFAGVLFLLTKLLQSDPGYIPPEKDHNQIRATIHELLRIGKYDSKNFCTHSWIRRPLRAKYKRFANSVIMRYDHYCPWIYNYVGFRNHKLFIYFIFLLEIGILALAKLCLEYFDELKDNAKNKDALKCSILSKDLCAGFKYDPFTFFLLAWACFQGMWILTLNFVQLFECLKGVTEFEFSQWQRQSRGLGGREHVFNTAPEELMDEDPAEERNKLRSVGAAGQRHCCSTFTDATGFDRFLSIIGSALGRRTPATHAPINYPIETDYGWRQNLKDFWLTSDVSAPMWRRILLPPAGTRGLLNGQEVDYQKLYELPERVVSIEQIV
ncbi:AaceriAER388Cp [[Ashbya] aceris (nom. inval.)]|nr:AaceriAER388Cp [[Ashbya] aceris (nom. inval.)]